MQKQYADSFQELQAFVDLNAYRKEYSKGGVTLHRGYYSPSSLDLVVGGCNRGKLIKGLPKNNSYDYEYIFDGKDNLICTKKYSDEFESVFRCIAIEFLVYEQNRVLSFTFDLLNNYTELSFISECQYNDDILLRYESALCYEGNDCIEINVEIPEYADHLLKSVCSYRYNPFNKMLDQNKFVFFRDMDGYLSTYTIEQLDKQDASHDTKLYKVNVKRK